MNISQINPKMHWHANQRGSVMVSALVIFASVLTVGFYLNYQATEKKREVIGVFQKANASIETDNAVKAASTLAQQALQADPMKSEADMQAYLNTEMPKHVSKPLVLKSFTVKYSSGTYTAPIARGPFAGIDADNMKITYSVIVGSPDSTIKDSKVILESTLSGIPITQFTVFGSTNVYSGTANQNAVYTGRIHGNGFVAIGGTGTQSKIRGNVTSATQVYPAQQIFTGTGWVTNIALAPTYADATLTPIKTSAQFGCTNCDGTGLDWSKYSEARWNKQLLDSSHGVKELKLRVLQEKVGSFGSTKFLIDPVQPNYNASTQPQNYLWKKEQFAYKADVRIINGVWYLKNPANEDEWPGLAVWSDHPGRFTTWNDDEIEGPAKAVGQEDIRDNLNAQGMSANVWPAGTTPKKFSYYTYNTSTSSLVNYNQGTISYGNLFRNSGGSVSWSPGHFPTASVCPTGFSCLAGCDSTVHLPGTFYACRNMTTGQMAQFTDPLFDLLNATRGGFRNGAFQQSVYGTSAKSKIWPVNFDVAAFQAALSCQAGVDHPGELGCYFGAGKYMNRNFNGIVYITSTWNGQNRVGTGLATYPQRAPYLQNDTEVQQIVTEGGGPAVFPGSNNDPDQPAASVSGHSILPMQLCSTSLAGQNYIPNKFKIPLCDKYRDHATFRARINSLRVINAASISSTILPKGLTIATNLGLYSTGDVNSASNVAAVNSTPWSPVFLAGDYYIPLSKGWSDTNSRWDVATDTAPLYANRVAAATTINAGTSPIVHFLNEDWTGINLTKVGPHVNLWSNAGENSTHYVPLYYGVTYGNDTYKNPPTLMFVEDPHFRLLANQPPGVPFVSTYSVDSWVTKESSKEK